MSKLNNWMLSKVALYKGKQEEAQGLVEYGLILALISVVCVVTLGLIGGSINSTLTTVNGKL